MHSVLTVSSFGAHKIEKPERHQQQVTKTGKGPLHTGGGAGLFSSGEEVPAPVSAGCSADLTAVYKYGKGSYKDGRVISFLAVPGDTLRSNNHKVSPERFR